MDKYFCVFQMPSDKTPCRVAFEAEHPGMAIVKLMSLAKITNTMELEQAEILKCVRGEDGKTAYIPVFVKEKDEPKGRILSRQKQVALPPPVIDAAAITEQLDVYKKPYTVEVL